MQFIHVDCPGLCRSSSIPSLVDVEFPMTRHVLFLKIETVLGATLQLFLLHKVMLH